MSDDEEKNEWLDIINDVNHEFKIDDTDISNILDEFKIDNTDIKIDNSKINDNIDYLQMPDHDDIFDHVDDYEYYGCPDSHSIVFAP